MNKTTTDKIVKLLKETEDKTLKKIQRRELIDRSLDSCLSIRKPKIAKYKKRVRGLVRELNTNLIKQLLEKA